MQIPTVGGAEARAFHYVISVAEKEQILGVVAATDSVLWAVAPSEQEAAALRIQDQDSNPVEMTMRASSLQFDGPRPQVSEVWKQTGRVVRWSQPVQLTSGLKLGFSDHERPFSDAYKIALVWDQLNWKWRAWTAEDTPAKAPKGNERGQAPDTTNETTLTIDDKQITVRDSYRLVNTKKGLVAEVQVEAAGLGRETFVLPFPADRSVQDALAAGTGGEKPSWTLASVSPGSLYCMPVNQRTVLVLSRPQLLRASLASSLDQLQAQLIIAATRARPPYELFLSFEKAYRAATLLAGMLAERELSTDELKIVRLSLANATLFFRNLHLWTSTVQVPLVAGAVRELQIFFPKGAAEHRCALTHAVLYERLSGGRGYLGQARLDRRTEVLELDLDAELAVDPFVYAHANEQLAKSGHRIEGPFTDWTLSPLKPETPGLRSVRVTDQQRGRLAITLGLEVDKAGLVLWRLATGAGLPLRFRWEAGPEGAKSAGEVELPFSLGRRSRHPLSLDAGKLTNASEAVVYAEYIQVGEKFLFPKQPGGVLLLAKQGVEVARFFDTTGIELSKAVLPSTAVGAEISNPLDEFVQDEGLSEQFRVRNLLPFVDEERKRTLRFVEVYVIQVRKVGEVEAEERAGPLKLFPPDTGFSERSVSFLKRGGKVRYRVEAHAYYTDGSTTDFEPVTVDRSEVNLTAALLKGAP